MNVFYKGEKGKFVFQEKPPLESSHMPAVYFEMYSGLIID